MAPRASAAVATVAVVAAATTIWYYRRHRRRERSDDGRAFEREQIRLKSALAKLARDGNLARASDTGAMVSLTKEQCGGTTARYAWTQSEDEIVVSFAAPADATSRECEVTLTSTAATVRVRGQTLLDGELTRAIVKDDSYWELESDGSQKVLRLSLTKLRRTCAKFHWPSVCVGEPEIDVAAFGDPVMGGTGNLNGDAMKTMIEDVAAMRRDAEKN